MKEGATPRGWMALLLVMALGAAPGALGESSADESPVPFLFADLNVSPLSLDPRPNGSLVEIGEGRALFNCAVPDLGAELCITDGTREGSRLLKDIVPGRRASNPRSFIRAGDAALFVVWRETPSSANDLWRSDGTVAGTRLLRTAVTGEIVRAGDLVYFAAGGALWASDGASAWHLRGAGRFADPQNPGSLAADGDRLFFAAETHNAGAELWVTQGTTATARPVKDIVPGPASSSPHGLVAGDGVVYFQAGPSHFERRLWRSDGTLDGTQPFSRAEAGRAAHYLPIGDEVFIAMNAEGLGNELWAADAETGETRLVKDISPSAGAHGSLPRYFHDVGGTLVFLANDGVHGFEPWRSDGTAEGTRLLRDILSGPGHQNTRTFVHDGDQLWFTAISEGFGSEAWVTDGTVAGTRMLRDFAPGPDDSHAFGFTRFGGTLTLLAIDASTNRTIYRTDGTPEGTTPLFEAAPGNQGSDPGFPIIVGDEAYFSARVGSTGEELWVSDGTRRGTRLVRDIAPGFASSGPSDFVAVGDRVLFVADEEVGGEELWVTDGSEEGTARVVDLEPGERGSSPLPVGVLGDVLIFSASVANETRLYRTDGTEEGTVPIGTVGGDRYAVVVDDVLYFRGHVPGEGGELWRTDGTEEGTWMVYEFVPGNVGGNPTTMRRLGNRIYFGAGTLDDAGLWSSDGTAAGTQLVKGGFLRFELGRGVEPDFDPEGFFFARAMDGAHGREIWVTDGTAGGTQLVKDIRPGIHTSLSSVGVRIGRERFFAADDGVHGEELWRSDGTEEGTTLVADIVNPIGGGFFSFGIADDFVLLGVADGLHGAEPWISDGTAAGTRLLANLGPGTASSFPRGFKQFGSLALFSADDGLHGRELWAVALPGGGYTPMGSEVEVEVPVSADGGPGSAPSRLVVTIANVTGDGTTVARLEPGRYPRPWGYLPIAVPFEVTPESTADISGPIAYCVEPESIDTEATLMIYDGVDATWRDITTERHGDRLCGASETLSPLGVFRPASPAELLDALIAATPGVGFRARLERSLRSRFDRIRDALQNGDAGAEPLALWTLRAVSGAVVRFGADPDDPAVRAWLDQIEEIIWLLES